jgi:hypothetical protein
MQNRYVCDIGDFGKYALLRALSKDLRLGVVWYLNLDEESNSDGGFTEYAALRECDDQLYDKMQTLLKAGSRGIAAVEQAGILPVGTAFYSQPLTFRDLPSSNRLNRQLRRQLWLQTALAATEAADLVFLDPDNGFAPDSVRATGNSAQKYVFRQEICQFLNRGHSVIIYHHHARHERLTVQVKRHFKELRAEGAKHIWALSFHKRSVRTFFIAAAERHAALLLDRSQRFVKTLWGIGGRFELHLPIESEAPPDAITSPSSAITLPRRGLASSISERVACEVWDGRRWRAIGTEEALEMRRQRRWAGGRCAECHERVRVHKAGTTGQRAHFEHLQHNARCSSCLR